MIESGGAWHIVILQPTDVELITVIISHSISGQKPPQSTWLDQILGSGRLRENYGEGQLLGLFYCSSAFSPSLSFGLFVHPHLSGVTSKVFTATMTIRFLGKSTWLLIDAAGSKSTLLAAEIFGSEKLYILTMKKLLTHL